jgi:hypothetical protein
MNLPTAWGQNLPIPSTHACLFPPTADLTAKAVLFSSDREAGLLQQMCEFAALIPFRSLSQSRTYTGAWIANSRLAKARNLRNASAAGERALSRSHVTPTSSEGTGSMTSRTSILLPSSDHGR